tara:strand:- start:125 stop:346 length:222 start_codon:yes stop_codon:yes gene_type:complete
MNNNISKKQWLSIIDNYFTNYYDNESTRIKRRNYRALYLSNLDNLKKNNFELNTRNKILSYNKWYINYYKNNI